MRVRKLQPRSRGTDPNSKKHPPHLLMWTNLRNDFISQPGRLRSKVRFWFIDRRLGNRGFTTWGGTLLLITVATGSGLALMIQNIHSITRNQVSMDRCTGEAVLKLRAAGITMESSYRRLEGFRLMVIASLADPVLFPEAVQLFRKAAQIEKAIQNQAKLYWEWEEKNWSFLLQARCKIPWSSTIGAFPQFPFSIVNPEIALIDLLKIKAFSIEIKTPLHLRLSHGKLQSEAVLERKKNDAWEVAWKQ